MRDDGNRMSENGDDMQQMATGWTSTLGHCSEDTASVHGTLSTEALLLPIKFMVYTQTATSTLICEHVSGCFLCRSKIPDRAWKV